MLFLLQFRASKFSANKKPKHMTVLICFPMLMLLISHSVYRDLYGGCLVTIVQFNTTWFVTPLNVANASPEVSSAAAQLVLRDLWTWTWMRSPWTWSPSLAYTTWCPASPLSTHWQMSESPPEGLLYLHCNFTLSFETWSDDVGQGHIKTLTNLKSCI